MTRISTTQPAPRASSSAKPAQRILIVDDEPEAGQLCKGALSSVSGWVVRYEQHPLRAQALVREWQPDLVILDVTMAELDGITLGQRLKADDTCHAALMFVTSRKEAEAELDGLRFAEEYIKKPYNVPVLVRRVEKVLERRQQTGHSSQAGRSLRSSRPEIDLVSRFVRVPHGNDATLTPVELKLLLALLEGNGKPVPYSTLLAAVWKVEDESELGYSMKRHAMKRHTNRSLLNTTISRLRKKIEVDSTQPELIITVPRGGYCYLLKPELS